MDIYIIPTHSDFLKNPDNNMVYFQIFDGLHLLETKGKQISMLIFDGKRNVIKKVNVKTNNKTNECIIDLNDVMINEYLAVMFQVRENGKYPKFLPEFDPIEISFCGVLRNEYRIKTRPYKEM